MNKIYDEVGEELIISKIWGDKDDIQFELEYAENAIIVEDQVYEYVNQHYSKELYQEWADRQADYADYAYDLYLDK
jgi:hypothetical protein